MVLRPRGRGRVGRRRHFFTRATGEIQWPLSFNPFSQASTFLTDSLARSLANDHTCAGLDGAAPGPGCRALSFPDSVSDPRQLSGPPADGRIASPASASGRALVLIRRVGLAYCAVLSIYFLASPFLAAVAPFEEARMPGRAEGLGIPLSRIPLPQSVLAALNGRSFLSVPEGFLASYGVLVVAATMLWISALLLIRAHEDFITPAHVSSALRWSMVFTAILLFATPVLVHDLWLSVAWGRVVAAGSNPYYVEPTRLADLPLGEPPGLMTYGPLWALISGASAALSGGSALAAAALQKVVIAGAWAASVRVVRLLTRNESPATQCRAVVLFGWSPLGLIQGVGDGHNDVVLVLPMLTWLLWSWRARTTRSTLALAASVMIKYVTAPLFLLHLARELVERKRVRASLSSTAVAAGLMIGAMALFYRSPDFFAAARDLQSFHFFTPSAVIEGLGRWIGVPVGALSLLIDLSFFAGAIVVTWRWIRAPSEAAFRAAALWTMLAVLLGAVGHVWPWFVLWVLPLAAIQAKGRVRWFVGGLAAAAPFLLLPWTVAPALGPFWRIGAPGLMLYAIATGAMLFGERALDRVGRRSH